MSRAENPIENARTFETAINIISEKDIATGVEALKWRYKNLFPYPDRNTLSPVMQAGVLLGRDLASVNGQPMNPIRMTYYQSDGERMDHPECRSDLDIYKVLDFKTGATRSVTFVEAVVDTQGTLLAAMDRVREQVSEVNRTYGANFLHPKFYVFAILSKINGGTLIPNFNYAYKFNPDIWAFGYGCDAGGKARTVKSMFGYLSPFANRAPDLPYYSESDLLQEYLKHTNKTPAVLK